MPEATAPPELPAVQCKRTLPAARERVFRAWTDPEELKSWIAPEGVEILSAEADVRVGGDYRFGYRAPDGQVLYVVGTYVEIDPPERLAFTWIFEGVDRTETLVTVDLNDSGGDTDVVVTHERFTNEASRSLVQNGWPAVLGRLAELLSPRYT